MQLFIEIYGFLGVVLRGFILAAQSLTVGGLAFLVLLSWPLAPRLGDAGERISTRALRLISWSAGALAAAEAVAAVSLAVMLAGTLEISFPEAISARAAIADLIAAAIALSIALVARNGGPALRFLAPALGALLLVVQAVSTHATSQLEGAVSLAAAELLHMSSAAVWIGGIPFFLIALTETNGAPTQPIVGRRFSLISIGAVAALLSGGVFLALDYVDAPPALYGTSYGLMLGAKIVLLMGLLFLGGMNFLAVRGAAPMLRTRRFAETEIGVGLTVLFCAASLASLPPARDIIERASLPEIVERLEPRWPVRLESPDHSALSVSQEAMAAETASAAAQSRWAADIAWSEYNHHWAGLFVLAMGAMALMERGRRLAPFARHWPLMFLGLAAFLFLRADEAVWPLGKLGVIESLRDPEIAQHRLLTLLIVAFGIFEWRVRLGRVKAGWAAYVFPLSTAVAAGFLLTHSHALTNVKEETLLEITHTPLALVGVAAGWSRWLELRLDGRAARIAGFVWPIAFILAGLMLLFYREA
ncbi:copper resistance D family protein [Methylocystis sp. ATCC 49242]|uniref:copper resistance D family protein n=1 Tax=Methylocystis sp. ATCC 49242 TaxID=622637 RepID=UPI0001F86C5C|nr:CopD family protein [Methylocystis sp. ATCC 49242]